MDVLTESFHIVISKKKKKKPISVKTLQSFNSVLAFWLCRARPERWMLEWGLSSDQRKKLRSLPEVGERVLSVEFETGKKNMHF